MLTDSKEAVKVHDLSPRQARALSHSPGISHKAGSDSALLGCGLSRGSILGGASGPKHQFRCLSSYYDFILDLESFHLGEFFL